MTQGKEKGIGNKDGEKLASKQCLDAEELRRRQHRADQQQRLPLSIVVFTVIAWLLGKTDVSILWIFFLLAWIFFWWKNTATKITDHAAKQAEIDKRRERVLSNAETAEWLNFIINRW